MQLNGSQIFVAVSYTHLDFSEAALSKVSTKDLGEVGDMITDLIGELKSFDANESGTAESLMLQGLCLLKKAGDKRCV